MTAEGDALRRSFDTAVASGTVFLTPMGPLILAAAGLELALDSRSFARRFGVAHALVIRECTSLSDDLGLIKTECRGGRSQRLFYRLTSAGEHSLGLKGR
ncbi:hypothetical protein [Paracoccus albus]|uniref:hypothetical protein n=1 Tax=Paracoccus albus TaxID=3017784 RepID=UPI0022F0E955|nr:hypothetical protein [Paracoccus albus]WBU61592.1 hypothetical protein PAF20_06745 [Paracoccus albus]